jgi:hypothetical protein
MLATGWPCCRSAQPFWKAVAFYAHEKTFEQTSDCRVDLAWRDDRAWRFFEALATLPEGGRDYD